MTRMGRWSGAVGGPVLVGQLWSGLPGPSGWSVTLAFNGPVTWKCHFLLVKGSRSGVQQM